MPNHTPTQADVNQPILPVNNWLIAAAVGVIALLGLILAYILGYNPFAS